MTNNQKIKSILREFGIYLPKSIQDRYMREYNNFEIPINERINLLAQGDLKFIEFVQLKIKEKNEKDNI